MIGKEVMETLREHIGKEVRVCYVYFGRIETVRETLKGVTDFINIKVESLLIPFIGRGVAIREIVGGENRRFLYENLLVFPNYALRKEEEVDRMIALSFGEEVAAEFRQRREVEEQQWAEAAQL